MQSAEERRARASHVRRGRGYDRLINFSDAVVAIAITLLGLPLVDILPPTAGQNVLDVLGANAGKLWAFAFTFFVVALLWLAHHRVFDTIDAYDGGLIRLNMYWLLTIVLLPLPSNWVGEAGFGRGLGMFYCSVLALNSILLWLIVGYASRRPELLAPGRDDEAAEARRSRSLVFAAYFLAIGAVSLVAPDLASWGMMGLIPLSIWMNRRADGRAAAARAARTEGATDGAAAS